MGIKTKQEPRQKNPFSYLFAKTVLKLVGWKVEFELPKEKKYLLISEPHTTNWDLPLMLLISKVIGVQLNWAAKDTIFRGLHGKYLKWLGGIPVNRRSRTKFTDQIIEIFNQSKKMIFVIAPAGTRSYTEYWRSGFYRIANEARVPIAFGFLDYGNKIGGIKPGFLPSGNIEEDFKLIREFYKDIKGKNPENFGPIQIKPTATKKN